MQTDEVIILPELCHSSYLSASVSDGIQSSANQRSFYESKSADVKSNLQNNSSSDELLSSSSNGNQMNTNRKSFNRCSRRYRKRVKQKSSCNVSSSTASSRSQRNQRWFDGLRPHVTHSLQRKSAYDNCIQEVMPHIRAPPSFVADARISRHWNRVDDQDHISSCPTLINFSQNASGSMSLESHCGVMKTRSVVDDGSYHLKCQRRQRRHYRYNKAGNSLPSYEIEWNHPQVANRSAKNTKASGNGRSNFSHVDVGMMTNGSTKTRTRKHSRSNAATSRPKYRRLDSSTASNWQQPGYDQSLVTRSGGSHQMWLPSPACFAAAFFCQVPMFFPHLPPVVVTPSLLFPTFSIPIPLWCLGSLRQFLL